MLLDQINLNRIRVFDCVYRTRSMTAAAAELHLTQSGVSQHIRTLEDTLGVPLFDRIQQRLVPTSAASQLHAQCSQALNALESAMLQIQQETGQLKGLVSIGMPIEFGNNRVLPLLAEFARNQPEIKLRIQPGFASVMSGLLLEGKLDFAFVDDFALDPKIATERICDETLELCISSSLKKALEGDDRLAESTREYFERLDFIGYQEPDPILNAWFKHHFSSPLAQPRIRATVMNVHGVSRLILEGLGAGILPGYICDQLMAEGHGIHKFRGSGIPVENRISVALLRERSQSRASSELLAFLKSELLVEENLIEAARTQSGVRMKEKGRKDPDDFPPAPL